MAKKKAKTKCAMGCPVIHIKCKQAKAPKSLAERLAHYKTFKMGAGLGGFAPGTRHGEVARFKAQMSPAVRSHLLHKIAPLQKTMSSSAYKSLKTRVTRAPAHCTVTMGRSVFPRLTNEKAAAKVKELANRQRAVNCIPQIKT